MWIVHYETGWCPACLLSSLSVMITPLVLCFSLFSLELVPLHFTPSTFSLTFTPHHKSICSALCLNCFFFFPPLVKLGQPCCLCPPVLGIYFTVPGYCAHVQSPQLLLYPEGAELLPSQARLTSYWLSTSKVPQAPHSSTPLSSKALQPSLRNIDLTSNCGQYQMLQRNKISCMEKYARICCDQMDKTYS